MRNGTDKEWSAEARGHSVTIGDISSPPNYCSHFPNRNLNIFQSPTINYLMELDNNFLGPWLLILAAIKPSGEMFLRYYPIRILRQDQLVIDEEISQCEKTKLRHHCWDIWRVFPALFTGTWSHCWTSRTFLWRRTDINIFTDLQDKPWNPHIKQRRWNIIRWLSAGFGTDFPQ